MLWLEKVMRLTSPRARLPGVLGGSGRRFLTSLTPSQGNLAWAYPVSAEAHFSRSPLSHGEPWISSIKWLPLQPDCSGDQAWTELWARGQVSGHLASSFQSFLLPFGLERCELWWKTAKTLQSDWPGFKSPPLGTSLGAQWLRICLPMQGTWVRALVQEDPTCRRATKPVRHHYWVCALEHGSHNYWAHVPQLLKPACLEPMFRNKEKLPQWKARAPQQRVAPARRN